MTRRYVYGSLTVPEDVADLEPAEDAVVSGDLPYKPGSARAALSHRNFRLVWLGGLGAQIGTWMRTAALGAFAYELTNSSSFVAQLGFAQLGPLLVLSLVGGLLADSIDRRLLLILGQVEQMILSFALAFFAAQDNPSRAALFFCVLGIGIGNALSAPTLSAVLPQLVGQRDLPGAISLQSAQMNLSRVIGPVIGGLILPTVDASGVFAINGFTYIFSIVAFARVDIPRPYPDHSEQGIRRLLGGFRIARDNRIIGQCLTMITVFSFFSLCFIGLMPVIAGENLGLDDVTGATYGLLFAVFGLGAALGAVSVGTVFVDFDKARVVRIAMPIFAVFLTVFTLLRSPGPAFPVVFLVGLFYFASITSLSTVLQEHLDPTVRGRVMALWIMGFGGTVPIGLLIGGWAAEVWSVTPVVLVGAVVALILPAALDLRERSRQ